MLAVSRDALLAQAGSSGWGYSKRGLVACKLEEVLPAIECAADIRDETASCLQEVTKCKSPRNSKARPRFLALGHLNSGLPRRLSSLFERRDLALEIGADSLPTREETNVEEICGRSFVSGRVHLDFSRMFNGTVVQSSMPH